MVDVNTHKQIIKEVEAFKKTLCEKYKIDLKVGVEISGRINHKSLLKKAAPFFECTYTDLVSDSRNGNLIKCRKFLTLYIRNELKLSYTYIGKLLNRDHSTIVHSYNSISTEIETYPKIAEEFESFKTYVQMF